MAKAVGLSDQIWMQRNAHHEGLVLGLLQHLVKIVDYDIRENARAILSRDNCWDVVCFQRLRERQQRSVLCTHPDGLVVHAPIERVIVPGLFEQIGRDAAFGDPWG